MRRHFGEEKQTDLGEQKREKNGERANGGEEKREKEGRNESGKEKRDLGSQKQREREKNCMPKHRE